ncbi:MAG: hypothetical protein ACI9GW_003554 [Halieaceae bacterium]
MGINPLAADIHLVLLKCSHVYCLLRGAVFILVFGMRYRKDIPVGM